MAGEAVNSPGKVCTWLKEDTLISRHYIVLVNYTENSLVSMEDKTMDKQIWNGLLGIYMDIQKTHPKAMNILDPSYASMNENQHTSFLCGLLNYEYCGQRPFLESFIGMITDNARFADISKVRVTTQDNYIDCLISDGTKAIIIENKVCGAADQNKQLESYIIACQKQRGIPLDNIYVVYLTLSGGSPASGSLSQEDIAKLESRYTERNYNDILQWLQKDVLYACHYHERLLTASIEAYIDRVRRMLGQEDEPLVAEQAQIFLEKHSVKSYKDILKLREQCPQDEHQDVYLEVVNSVLESMLRKNIYLDQDRTSYELKWILRNNPGLLGRNWTGGDFAPFNNSIGYFTLEGIRFVQLWAYYSNTGCRIHLECNEDGIKRGPYCFANAIPDYEQIWDSVFLKEHGFVIHMPGIFYFPYPDFTTDKPITDVARHIEKMIHLMNEAQKRKEQEVLNTRQE